MVANKKVSGKALAIPAGLGLGTAVSAGITVLGAMLLAWLVGQEVVPESGMGYGIMVLLAAAAALGSLVAVKQIKRQKLVVSLLTGLCYYVVLLACTALFFGGQYSGMGVTALMILLGAAGIGLIVPGGEKTRRNRHKIRRSR